MSTTVSVGGSQYMLTGVPGKITLKMVSFPWASITIGSEDEFIDLVHAFVTESEVAFPDLELELEDKDTGKPPV